MYIADLHHVAGAELGSILADAWRPDPLAIYLLLVAAGCIAGIVNTIAGGGSFLTLPVLIYFGGLDPQVANGTNRVAVLPSTIASSRVFHQHGLIDQGALGGILARLLIGVPIGAAAAIWLPQSIFRGVFGALFVAMAVLIACNPTTLLSDQRQPRNSPIAETAYFIGLGIYVGFLQAGYGLLMLVGLSLFQARDLVSSNAIKNVVGAVVTSVALAAFVLAGQVRWLPGLAMAAGNLAGGVIGAKLAIRKGKGLIFYFLVAVMLATGVKMLVDAFGASSGL